jgi:hypothetical protein
MEQMKVTPEAANAKCSTMWAIPRSESSSKMDPTFTMSLRLARHFGLEQCRT